MPRNFVKPYRRMQSRSRIEQMIRSGRLWGQRLMSERELAAELGVSRWTLQGALAELEADGLVERRQGSGTFVIERPPLGSRRALARLAAVVPRHFEEGPGWTYYGDILRGMLGQAPKLRAECTVLAMDRPAEAERVWSVREMRRFEGFICLAVDRRDLVTHLLDLRRGPVVVADHYIRDLPVTGVVDGSLEGMRAVARHLVALGHRRIGYIDTHNRDAVNPEKFAGYAAALTEKGLAVDEALVACPPGQGDAEAFAARATEGFLDLPDPATAIVAFDDVRAMAAIRAVEARGRRVGTDFSVAGFGDGAIRAGECDRLTSCRVYSRRIGQEAVRAALTPRPAGEGRTVIIPDRLFIRKSTCPPPSRQS